jgi:DisA bacterial checkpoint controller nucleotide-binding
VRLVGRMPAQSSEKTSGAESRRTGLRHAGGLAVATRTAVASSSTPEDCQPGTSVGDPPLAALVVRPVLVFSCARESGFHAVPRAHYPQKSFAIMSNSLQYYMWGFQHLFQVSVRLAAERLFTALDPDLKPRVFLVGFRTGDGVGQEPICISPEDPEKETGYPVSYFSDVPALAAEIEEEARAEGLLNSHPVAQRQADVAQQRRSWSKAVQRVLEREDQARGWRSFVSIPVEINNYRVMCVLQLPREVFDSYPRLRTEVVDEYYPVRNSLQAAVVDEFLGRCTHALLMPEPGSTSQVIEHSDEEMLRNAGRGFVLTIPMILVSYDLLSALYDALAELAGFRYEGAANQGRIILARKDNPHVQTIVELRRDVGLMEARAVRKLLEMTSDELALLADGGKAYGLGILSPSYVPDAEDAFLVEFRGERSWHLSHAGTELMRVRNGVPSLPPKPPSEARLVDTLERVLGPDADIPRLRELVTAASEQKHGTLVVISDHAAEEAARLGAQATVITPLVMTPELMRGVTAIDGAVLLDPHGTCVALGVILDGMASAEGTPARGARFNSALRYVNTVMQQFDHHCVAIVVSEDGPVNVVPDLLPRISRAELQQTIERFVALAEQDVVSRRDFNRLIGWLSDHRPYLSVGQATRINDAWSNIEPKLEKSAVWLTWRVFEGNPHVPEDLFQD